MRQKITPVLLLHRSLRLCESKHLTLFVVICFSVLETCYAQVSTLTAWTSAFHNALTTAQTTTFSVPAGSGTYRCIVVAVASNSTSVGARTITLTYGGQSFTLANGDMSTTTVKQHTQLYYLNEAGIDAASNTTLSVTVSASLITDVWYSIYDGVDQTTPLTDSETYSSGTGTSSTAVFSSPMSVSANDLAIEVISSQRVGNTTPRNITAATNWSKSNEQTSTTTDGVRNVVATRTIPTTSTTDASSTTISGATLASMTGMTLNSIPKLYRSNTASVTWGTANNWQQSGNGGTTWATATTAPTSSDGLVTILNGHTVTLGAAATASALTINSGGAFTTSGTAGRTITVTGATSVAGTMTFANTSTHVLNDVTVTGTWNESAAAVFTISGSFTNNASSFTASTGVHTFSGSSKTISGSTTLAIPNLTISGTCTNNGTVTVSTALSGSGTLAQGSSSALNIAGSSGITTLTATASGNTVTYNGTGAQTIKATDYNNLTISTVRTGSPTITLSSGVIGIAGTFSVTATGVGSYSTTGNTIDYDGSGAQTIINAFTYNNLTCSNSGTKTAGGNLVVSGTLTVGASNVLDLTNAFTLSGTLSSIANSGTIQTAVPTATSTTPIPAGKTWDGEITYSATAGSQTVVAGTYTDLTCLNSSGTNTAGATLTVNGVLTTTVGGTLDMGTFQLLGSLTSVDNNGTIRTSSVSASPIPTGKAWDGTVNYAAATGAQTIAAAISYDNLTLSNTSIANTLGGSITVNGIFTMSGGKLVLGATTLTLNGSIAGMTASGCLTANGSSNITVSGSGALGANLFLDQTTPGTTNRLAGLTINRASETITLGDTVEITGTLTPTAGTLATGDKLKLVSNASGTARVAAGSGSYITGNVTVQRYVPATARRWRFCGAPVSGQTMADLQDDIFITGNGNGFDPTLSNKPSVYSYTESITTGDINSGWVVCTDINDPITVAKGYRIFIRGDRSDPGRLDGNVSSQNAVTLDLTGALNTGDIIMPVTFNSSGTLANDGWNLVANPYPSAIDWDAIHDAGRSGTDSNFSGNDYAHIKPTVYIFDAVTNSYTSYNALSNASVGSLTTGIIPAGAAFWIQAVAASPELTLKEVYKTTSTPAAVFKTNPEQFKVKLVMDSITSDEASIKYIQQAMGSADAYDITKLYNADVNIASIGTDGSFLSANCKPFNGQTDTIRLSLGFATSGTYKMEFSNAEGLGLPDDKRIHLVDLFKQTVTDVTTNTDYTFTVDLNNPLSFGNERFMLVVDGVTTAIHEPELDNGATIYLFPVVTNDRVTIYHREPAEANTRVTVSDVTGKTLSVMNHPVWDGNRLVIDLSSYQSGSYFVTVENNHQILSTLRCFKQ